MTDICLELTLKVYYDPDTTTAKAMKSQLISCANLLAGNGMLSGDAEAIVDDWEVEVRTISEGSIDGETENEETQ